MRWNTDPEIKRRVIYRFLFFPRTIRGERRWLEFAYIKQRYSSFTTGKGWWKDVEWTDKFNHNKVCSLCPFADECSVAFTEDECPSGGD